MSVRILHDEICHLAALYCDLTGTAFGPIFTSDERLHLNAAQVARAFLGWLARDPRELVSEGGRTLEIAREEFDAARESWAGFCIGCGVAVLIGKEVRDPRYGKEGPYCSLECGEADHL